MEKEMLMHGLELGQLIEIPIFGLSGCIYMYITHIDYKNGKVTLSHKEGS